MKLLDNFDVNSDWLAHNFELQIFASYLIALDNFLGNLVNKHPERIEQIKQVVPNWAEKDYRDLEEYYFYSYQRFGEIVYDTYLVGLYTYLESELMERCRRVEIQHSYSLSVRDLRGQGVEQAMRYLLKVHHVKDSLSTSYEWREIQNIRRLRNCIAHNSGFLNDGVDQEQKLRKYIVSEIDIKIENSKGKIILGRKYCEKVLVIITNFLIAIDASIEKTEQSG